MLINGIKSELFKREIDSIEPQPEGLLDIGCKNTNCSCKKDND